MSVDTLAVYGEVGNIRRNNSNKRRMPHKKDTSMNERIKHPAAFNEIERVFDGAPITIREYYADGVVLVKLDDAFARANGFASMEEVYRISPHLRGFEWLDMAFIAEAASLLMRPKC